MEKFQKLFSALIIFRHNMQILHWKATGKDFDAVHRLCDEYTASLGVITDEITELMMEVGINPLGIPEVIELARDDDEFKYICLDADKLYSSKDVYKYIDIMFSSLCDMYIEIHSIDDLRDDICGKLEEHMKWLSLELNYKNKRRLDD